MLSVPCCRPGRLDKSLYVPLPDAQGRASILRTLARKTPLAEEVDLAALAHRPEAEGLSGADLQQLLREAAVAALKVCPAGACDDAAVLLAASRAKRTCSSCCTRLLRQRTRCAQPV